MEFLSPSFSTASCKLQQSLAKCCVMRRSTLSPEEERCRQSFDLITRLRGITDGELGQRIGMSQQIVNGRRNGISRIRIGEVPKLAEALEVPAELFSEPPAEILRWFAGQPAELVVRGQCSRYLTGTVAAYAA